MSRCKCDGHYTDRWHRWAVLKRGAGDHASTLYCLDCRHEWSSRAKYIVLLPDHQKRVRSGLTDADVLSAIETGYLRVDINHAVVFTVNNTMLKVTSRTHPKGPQRGTYRFVTICIGGKQKKVALHRLVWMAAHRSLVPDDCDIDHVHNQTDDSIGNLRLLNSSVNRARGSAKASSPKSEADENVPFQSMR